MKKYPTITPSIGIAIDVETTGSKWDGISSEYYQAISYGVLAFNTRTFEEIDHLYVETRFEPTQEDGKPWPSCKSPDGKYGWSAEAEAIHGLSRDYLKKNGKSRGETCILILDFINTHLGDNPKVLYLGHKVAFDIWFADQLFNDFDIEVDKFHLQIDTSQMSFLTIGSHKSNDLFDFYNLPPRTEHNALEDIRMTLGCVRQFREIFSSFVLDLL